MMNINKMIYDLFISKMVSRSFSRPDVMDTYYGIYSAITAYMKGTTCNRQQTPFTVKTEVLETKYFGTRKSDRYIRIYNKKQELLDNKEI